MIQRCLFKSLQGNRRLVEALSSSFLAQIKNSIAKGTHNATNMAETTQPKWKLRKNAHLRPILPNND